MSKLGVVVVGGGVIGLWQALELARRGHRVALREAAQESATGGASRLAGAMLAPWCESDGAPAVVRDLGIEGIAHWRGVIPDLAMTGSLVVAHARDRGELARMARITGGCRPVGQAEIAALEPGLAPFEHGLFYSDEGHLAPRRALTSLVGALRAHGAELRFAEPVPEPVWLAASGAELLIDCRGLAARGDVEGLRGVRGEMLVVEAPGFTLSRPVRLLHPRWPIYVVPWGESRFMVGATMIEGDGAAAMTVRSALELLGSAVSLAPTLGGARIVEHNAGLRPSFDDNVPKILARGRRLIVNGAFRHGYLMAPALARIAADHLEHGTPIPSALGGATIT